MGSVPGKFCDRYTGQCECLPHVVGARCDQCEANYWKIASGEGCEACNCDEVGAYSEQCNPVSLVFFSNFVYKIMKYFFSTPDNVTADQDLVEELVTSARPISGVILMLNANV